jgi:hypothetical protein
MFPVLVVLPRAEKAKVAAWLMLGAASLRMKVLAVPFVAVVPSEAVGFAPVEVETAAPAIVREPPTFKFPVVEAAPVIVVDASETVPLDWVKGPLMVALVEVTLPVIVWPVEKALSTLVRAAPLEERVEVERVVGLTIRA